MEFTDEPVMAAFASRLGARAAVSLVVEWFWDSFTAHVLTGDGRVAEISDATATSFWSDGLAGLPELLVLAERAGALVLDDEAQLLAALGRCAAEPPAELRLATESSTRRSLIAERLRALAAGPQLRREYLAMLGVIAETHRMSWNSGGRTQVVLAVAELNEALAARSYIEVLGLGHGAARTELVAVLGGLEIDQPVLVVPSATSNAVLAMDLGSVLVVGVPARFDARLSEARAQGLARRTRALGDATRLLILDALTSAPSGVSTLAQRFGLSQPTISNHVRVLRDAGLISDAPRGARRALVVERAAFEALVGELRALVPAEGEAHLHD